MHLLRISMAPKAFNLIAFIVSALSLAGPGGAASGPQSGPAAYRGP